jgi:hypothetical protein
MSPRLAAAVALTLAVGNFAQPVSVPDIAILNARVYTGDAAHPWAEAISIRASRIDGVGTTAEIKASAGNAARVIDAGGRLLIPGFNDAHAHPGAMPDATRLEGPPAVEHDPTLDEVIARINTAAAKAPSGQWIVGEIGSTVLDDPRATRATLDPLTGDHPLSLVSWTGHGTIYNTTALRALHVSETEPDPPGGFFGRMPDGKTLSGVAHEYAEYALGRRLTMVPDSAAQVKAFQAFAAEAASYGITTVQAMMTAYPTAEAVTWIESAGLPVRMRLIDFPLMAMKDWHEPASRKARTTSPLVTISGTKWIMDGTPIERLAFLRAPYADAPKTSGRLDFPGVDLRQFLHLAFDAHEQPILHVVGDGALANVLDAIEDTGGARWKPLRPRIEHGDMLQAADFARVVRMGVTIVQNPSHLMIGPLIQQRFGPERAARTDQLKAMVAAGVPLALGSDGVLNPFLNIMFATINQTNPSQALTVEQAVAAYTRGSAAAELAERQKGTIVPGMLADVALLSQDIFKVPASDLPRTTSDITIVNGRVVHESKR